MVAPLLLILVSAAPNSTLVFLAPEDLVAPRGVTLEAQLPQAGMTLEANDVHHPKLWYAPVAAEPTDHGARIWYERINSAETDFTDQRVLCVGEIRDGAWRLTRLNPKPPVWGGVNNVCMRRSPFKPTWGGFNVFQIVRGGPGYQMLYWDQPDKSGKAGAMVATSTDGTTWRREPGAVFTEHNDAFTLLPYGGEYLLYQTALEDWPNKPYADNLDKKRRVITLRRSKNLRVWTSQAPLLHPDAKDKPETEFYLMKAFPYGGRFAGLLMKYYADPKRPGRHSGIIRNELIVSADAIHWERPFRKTDIGFWSYADPFVLQDRLQFVVWKDGGMRTVSYRPGCLTAVCAGDGAPGSFTTRPFQYAGGAITLNADATHGWVEAELTDSSGNPVVGASRARVENRDGTRLELPLIRNGRSAGGPRECRLHFHLHNAKLFSVTIPAANS